MDKLKHIFFDLDHTLWDFEFNSREVLTEMHSKYQLSDYGIELGNMHSGFIANYELINSQLWSQYRLGKIKKQVLRKQRFELTLQCYNIKNEKLANTMAGYYTTACPQKKQLVEGAQALLSDLYNYFRLHIITNGFTEIQHTKMQRSGIDHYFTHIITSEMAEASKPDKAIFNYALKVVNALPAESIMIGDNLHVDVKGAENAGLQSVWFNPQKTIDKSVSSVSHLSELKRLLLQK